ncbi:MAG: FtsX-like permease family protein [Lachnospiraceae bacterium]|nr:FtsX-like permease family protein [Lachnospiraceae bacterium]
MTEKMLLIRGNLHRTKGQVIAEILLILLAAGMMNLWLMLSLDYRQNFDRVHKKLNGEHVTLCIAGAEEQMQRDIADILEKEKRTQEFSIDDAMYIPGGIEYNGGETTTSFVLLKKEDALNRSIGKIELVEESEYTEGVYLPMIYKTGEITVGKKVSLTIGSKKMTYQVCGFFNSVMTGSHNCGMCEILLTEKTYQELEEKGYAPQSTLVSVRIADKSESENFETMLNHKVSEKYPLLSTISNSYALVSQSRYISQMICSGVVSAMAFFVLMIVLVVIASNIRNDIQENMKNLGVWKGLGYQSRQLIGSFLLQFLGITVLAALVGIALSYSLFPGVNDMMVSQTGIPYEVHFLPIPLLITLTVLWGTVAVTVWFSCGRIRKITPIDALRQGVQTHNFKRNYVPLDQTRLPLHAALSMKTTLTERKHNVTVWITMWMVSLIMVFSGLMLENVIVDMTPFMELVVGESTDSCININTEAEETFLREMEKDDRVEKVYLYHSQTVEHIGGAELVAIFSDDFSKVNNQKVVIEGRFPEFENEAAVAVKYARENGWNIGDEIRLGEGKKEENYIISGFTQISNNLGRDCILTREGYERLSKPGNLSYYLNLSEDVEIDEFNQEISRRFAEDVNRTLNVLEVVNGTSAVYISLMEVIVAAILLLSVLIILFVLYLLARTILNKKKKEYGVLKALGFTTAQLIFQTALSFMPTVILSTVTGLIVSSWVINPLTAVFLRNIGIVKCTFYVPVGFTAAAGIWVIVFAFAAACLLSWRIKKTVPRVLLANEL